MFLHAEDGSLVTNGRKDKLEEMSGTGNKAPLTPFEMRNITLPLMGEIAAGEPMENHAALDWDYIEIPKAFLRDRHDTYCALRVNGDSMKPHPMKNPETAEMWLVVARYVALHKKGYFYFLCDFPWRDW